MSLTIGQLADYCGVTVRAVRHYHHRGLLPEPGRDPSGYRRYGTQAVIDLIRIKVLADAGVPLARVRQLLAAEPDEFSAAVAEIDQDLQNRIADLEEHRHQLTELLGGDQLVLANDIINLLDQMRAMGVSDWTINLERDGWIMLSATRPDLVPEWARQKAATMADPEFRRLYLACDQARQWDPDDPRLEELAARMVEWTANQRHEIVGARSTIPADNPGLSVAEGLMAAQFADAAPAWRRLGELSKSKLSTSTDGAETGSAKRAASQ